MFDTDFLRIPVILDRRPCFEHSARTGTACYYVYTAAGKELPGVCNARARAAGFTGVISRTALRKTYS